jgi:phage/plasmid-like protein (TIGR03299 family)
MNATRIEPTNVISNASRDNENITNVDDLLETFSDLNFVVESHEMTDLTNDASFAGYRAIRRSDNLDVLSIVKERYTPIQNRDILEPLAEIVRENDARFVAGGVCHGGKKAWVQAELNQPVSIKTKNGEDILKNYIIGMIHHDGMGSNAILPFAKRIVCSNQFASIKRAAAGFSIRHSSSWERRVDEARNRFQSAMTANIEFAQAASHMALIDMGENEFKEFALNIVPDVKPNRYAPEGRSQEKKREIMFNLFRGGRGNIGRTRWDAFNAVTEYFDHYEGSTRIANAIERGQDIRKSMERRFLNSLAGGQTNIAKHKAYDLLIK